MRMNVSKDAKVTDVLLCVHVDQSSLEHRRRARYQQPARDQDLANSGRSQSLETINPGGRLRSLETRNPETNPVGNE